MQLVPEREACPDLFDLDLRILSVTPQLEHQVVIRRKICEHQEAAVTVLALMKELQVRLRTQIQVWTNQMSLPAVRISPRSIFRICTVCEMGYTFFLILFGCCEIVLFRFWGLGSTETETEKILQEPKYKSYLRACANTSEQIRSHFNTSLKCSV